MSKDEKRIKDIYKSISESIHRMLDGAIKAHKDLCSEAIYKSIMHAEHVPYYDTISKCHAYSAHLIKNLKDQIDLLISDQMIAELEGDCE